MCDKPLREGWLLKKGALKWNKWNRRYVRVYPNAIMYYTGVPNDYDGDDGRRRERPRAVVSFGEIRSWCVMGANNADVRSRRRRKGLHGGVEMLCIRSRVDANRDISLMTMEGQEVMV